MDKTIYIGIDPGASGAMAIRYANGAVIAFPWQGESDFVSDIDNISDLMFLEHYEVVAVVEQVGGFVGKAQPGSAMFKFGENYGFIRGVLAKAQIPYRLVRPQQWQKGLPKTPKLADKAAAKRQHKNDLKDRAAALFPKVKVTLANADALLLLDYAMRNFPSS